MASASRTTAKQDGLGPGITSLAMQVDAAGKLDARIALAAPLERAPDIRVTVDGAPWATLPAQWLDPSRQALGLACSLPQGPCPANAQIGLSNARDGSPIGRRTMPIATPVTNPHGLLARDVYEPAVAPMFSVPWMEFDGATITVSGAHLPPLGDPSRLSVTFNEGVSGSFDYPLPSPEFGAHYWYWPNAHFSGFQLRINLPASAPGSDPFTFRFEAPSSAEGSAQWPDRARIWIPSDLRSFTGFPPGGTQLTRVQTWSEQKTVTLTGYNAFRGFESLLARHGVPYRPGMRLLDWGCGHGRVARHFIQNWLGAEITGADIDAENIAWCQANLHGGRFLTAPLWPPLDLPDACFDAVIGLSVMTHLTAEAQRAWLGEIRRILKPGGVALISFGGDGAASFASFHHTPAWWARWRETGFDDGLADPALAGKIADAEYYRVTHQTARQARAAWSAVMPVVAIEPQAFGYQDIAVFRRA